MPSGIGWSPVISDMETSPVSLMMEEVCLLSRSAGTSWASTSKTSEFFRNRSGPCRLRLWVPSQFLGRMRLKANTHITFVNCPTEAHDPCSLSKGGFSSHSRCKRASPDGSTCDRQAVSVASVKRESTIYYIGSNFVLRMLTKPKL